VSVCVFFFLTAYVD